MSRAHAGVRGGRAVAGVLLVLALLTTGLVTDHARAAEEITPRDKMLALTNRDRTERDKKALRLNAKLSRYAARHSEDMAEVGLVHTSEKALRRKLDALDIAWRKAGENIGVASSLETLRKTLVSLEKAFMKSIDHRANILEREYDHAAIGVFESPDDETTAAFDPKVWVTVIFYG